MIVLFRNGMVYSCRMKTGFGVQCKGGGKGRIEIISAGQINHIFLASNAGTKNAKANVQSDAPIAPSQVLFGDKARNGAFINFRPKVIPTKYADTSFMMTEAIGKKYQKIPLSVVDGKYLH